MADTRKTQLQARNATIGGHFIPVIAVSLQETRVDQSDVAGNSRLELSSLLRPGQAGRETVEEVRTGLRHIIAHTIAHDQEMRERISEITAKSRLVLQSKRAKERQSEAKKKAVEPGKFENYFEFSCPVQQMKPHQVLAINRGEAGKALSVKILLPDDWFLSQLRRAVKTRWLTGSGSGLIQESVEDAYKRLICPLVQRRTRARLTRAAEEASVRQSGALSLVQIQPDTGL